MRWDSWPCWMSHDNGRNSQRNSRGFRYDQMVALCHAANLVRSGSNCLSRHASNGTTERWSSQLPLHHLKRCFDEGCAPACVPTHAGRVWVSTVGCARLDDGLVLRVRLDVSRAAPVSPDETRAGPPVWRVPRLGSPVGCLPIGRRTTGVLRAVPSARVGITITPTAVSFDMPWGQVAGCR